ncbi:hypothetical protein [Candidatus Palauibacter sp.]|uniref:hypothetical protein n=1 Tax=Candidatus Palauibacter sp. TaxID=3101350 RepID=UPI003B014C09
MDVTLQVLPIASLAVATIAAFAAYLLFRVSSDPHVIVYVKHDRDRPTLLLLVIKNIGRGVAYGVKCELSRSIPRFAPGIRPTGKKTALEEMAEGPLISGVPALAPGEQRVLTWGQYGGLRDELGSNRVQVRALFEGGWLIRTGHQAESVLEVTSFERTDAAESPAQAQVKQLERIACSAEALSNTVRRWDMMRGALYLRQDGQPTDDADVVGGDLVVNRSVGDGS